MSSDPPGNLATHPYESGSSVPGSSVSYGSQRKERGAIAAQACDTCRSRKQKCDEQRPRCGTCRKFNLDCKYREPQPTKKDKTLMEILDRIKALESKIDNLSFQDHFPAASYPLAPSGSGTATDLFPVHIDAGPIGDNRDAPAYQPPNASRTSSGDNDHYVYVSSVHQMLRWPAFQQVLESARPKAGPVFSLIERHGPAAILGPHHHGYSPPSAAGSQDGHGCLLCLPVQAPGAMPHVIARLTWDAMQQLSEAFFDTFNLMCPIVDRQSFMSETIFRVFSERFSDSTTSTIALLIFALGEVALAATKGLPVHVLSNGRPSGMRGGNINQPPGMTLFNEARRKMGFVSADCSLESVQAFALAGLYYGTCCHDMEFWRMTTSASLACRALITSKPAELSSERADLIRRAFWHCSIMETSLNLELGLPLTGLERLEHVVGLPSFSDPFTDKEYQGNESSHFQEHFASQIVLRRLLVNFHNLLSQAPNLPEPASGTSYFVTLGSSLPVGLPSQGSIKELAHQLSQWHGMLPAALRWQETQPGAFPIPPQATHNAAPSATPLMFTSDLDTPPTQYPYALDIQVALLRTRYYYVKHLIHRPFLYKALHHPDAVTAQDADGVATCLRAMLCWPITMSPASAHKRFLPCLFFWTQNILGILVVLHLSRTVPALTNIAAAFCGKQFELEASETIELCIDWIRDMKVLDRVGRWAWDIVSGLYGLEE